MIRALFTAGLLLGATVAPARAEAPESARVAVAPFDAPEGLGVAAASLAADLAELLGAPVLTPPLNAGDAVDPLEMTPRGVRDWASARRVETIVVGLLDAGNEETREWTLEVSLLSGHSGAEVARHQLSAETQAGLGAQAASLAERIELDLSAVGLPAVAAAPPERETLGDSLRITRDEPIAIESDQLEVIQREEGRRLVFTRNVVVTQGDLQLRARRLEALYPDGSSQPERLVATGQVEVERGDRRANCDRAVYEREHDTVVCSGHAELLQGCDRVRGRRIEFDLTRDDMRVSGAASVVVLPEAEDGSCGEEPS